jgi:mannose-6-phosphate isomerase-like protein (cupin superfamily)
MDRRLFLQFPVVIAGLAAGVQNNVSDRPNKGFIVAAGKDRFNEEIHFLSNRMLCKVSAKDTDGDVCIFHNIIASGPYLHYHYSQDEWFFVLKGKFQFKVGEETFMAQEGDSVFGPRKIPHAFANIGEAGHLLAVYQPAGSIEEFFKEGSKMKSPTPMELKEMSRRHGIEIVGPPLKVTG